MADVFKCSMKTNKEKGRKKKIFFEGRIQDVLHKDQKRVELAKEIE